jgi:hypothetical protein
VTSEVDAVPALDAVAAPTLATRRWYEGWLWFAGGALITLLLTWPLAARLSTHVPQDAADPLAEAWEVAWSGHALVHYPTRLFSANAFWPEGPSLAFSDSLMGYLPASLIGTGPTAALVRYNLLFLFAYALAFAGAALLARELGARPVAAAVAGVAFAWAPWRITHNGHLNILSTGGVALSLFLLASGYRRCRPWQVIVGWLVAAWQVSLGFALGIWFSYLLGVLFVVFTIRWWRRGRPRPPGMMRASLIGGGAFLLIAALMALPYVQVLHNYPDAPRSRAEVQFFSPPPGGFLAAAAENRFWGARTEVIRKTLPWAPEQALFPGVAVVLLAAAGLLWQQRSRSLRLGLAAAIAVGGVLSLGLRLYDGRFTYGPLYDYLPGWQGMRTPGRLAFVWSLGLAVAAALGTQRAWQHVAGPGADRRRQIAASAVAIALAAVVLYEGTPRLPLAPVPPVPPGQASLQGPLVHLPTDAFHDSTYMYWSTDGFALMSNGNTSYLPPTLSQIRSMAAFPDRASVAMLRSAGYRTVVLHLDLAPGTPWQDAAQRPVDGLGISTRTQGQLLIYDLQPTNEQSGG